MSTERDPACIPYARQQLDEADIAAVTDVLRSDWLTTGPMVEVFEQAFADATGSAHAVALANATAGLHAAMAALNLGAGDEVIVSPMTFVASANCIVYQGATPVFADVDPDTLLLDPASVRARITPRTRAIIAVDFAGQPCDYTVLQRIAERHGLALVADAAHSLGGSHAGRPVGNLADMSVFSLHPVKPISCGEGGVVTTNDSLLAERMRRFRNHGIDSDHRKREEQGSWRYEMRELGFNYRLTDFQCALALSQLNKLARFTAARQRIAAAYDAAFTQGPLRPLARMPDSEHVFHLYVVRTPARRAQWFERLRAEGIGVNVHYLPVHLHAWYREQLGTDAGLCPHAEAAYEEILSLPVFASMTQEQQQRVLETIHAIDAEMAA